mmetsp:Transcript_40921/g.122271  ORF Transcript_40921/g.122271 Transcript_40921/m.122271 type:complete len:211 (-) Transcript_40921:1338-1970(-)
MGEGSRHHGHEGDDGGRVAPRKRVRRARRSQEGLVQKAYSQMLAVLGGRLGVRGGIGFYLRLQRCHSTVQGRLVQDTAAQGSLRLRRPQQRLAGAPEEDVGLTHGLLSRVEREVRCKIDVGVREHAPGRRLERLEDRPRGSLGDVHGMHQHVALGSQELREREPLGPGVEPDLEGSSRPGENGRHVRGKFRVLAGEHDVACPRRHGPNRH